MAATPLYMSWWDDTSKKTLDMKIEEGLAYYRKYHGEPTVIIIPKNTATQKDFKVPVRVDTDSMVSPNYVYIGHDKTEGVTT